MNSIKWNDVTIHRSVMEYYRGLIAIRKRFPEFRLRTAHDIRSRLEYEDLGCGALAVHYGDRLILVINPVETVLKVRSGSLCGNYADSKKADAQPLYRTKGAFAVKPHSIMLAGLN